MYAAVVPLHQLVEPRQTDGHAVQAASLRAFLKPLTLPTSAAACIFLKTVRMLLWVRLQGFRSRAETGLGGRVAVHEDDDGMVAIHAVQRSAARRAAAQAGHDRDASCRRSTAVLQSSPGHHHRWTEVRRSAPDSSCAHLWHLVPSGESRRAPKALLISFARARMLPQLPLAPAGRRAKVSRWWAHRTGAPRGLEGCSAIDGARRSGARSLPSQRCHGYLCPLPIPAAAHHAATRLHTCPRPHPGCGVRPWPGRCCWQRRSGSCSGRFRPRASVGRGCRVGFLVSEDVALLEKQPDLNTTQQSQLLAIPAPFNLALSRCANSPHSWPAAGPAGSA